MERVATAPTTLAPPRPDKLEPSMANPPRAMQPNHGLTLFKGGAELFPALIEAIDAARSEVLLETYIFDFEGSALAVAEALERAAARGVTTCVVVDGIGTGAVPPEWQQRWKAAG